MLSASNERRPRALSAVALSPRISWPRLTIFAWALGAALMPAGWCDGAGPISGQTHVATGAGVSIVVDTTGLDGGGYRPVHVTVTPTRTVVADRTLTFQFLLDYTGTLGREDVRVEQDVELPANSGPVEAVIRVPQMVQWESYTIKVLEGDWVYKKMTMTGLAKNPWGFPGYPGKEGGASVLVVGDEVPDTSSLGRVLLADDRSYPFYGSPTNDQGKSTTELPTVISRPLADLLDRWLDYSNVDLLFIKLAELEQLSRENRGAFDAILGWTAAGGNLCVSGMGENWERIQDLESLIGLPESKRRTIEGAPPSGWAEPNPARWGEPVHGLEFETLGPFDGLSVPVNSSPGMAADATASQDNSPRTPAPKQAHYTHLPYEMGLIVAIAPESPFPGEPAEWAWMLNSIGVDRFDWSKRHGVTVVGTNPDFLAFLIPGVGLAPVGAFRLLIVLFVVAIGPVNYWLLRRWRRLHWLMVTIPVGAAATTAALFGYAIIADGLDTRARVRSVTRIDQRNGRAVCWSRISYYAGLKPSRGLSFSDDIVVIPYERLPRLERRTRRDLIWGQDQWLVSGWINSRTPTQVITVRSRASQIGVAIDDASAATGKLGLTNGLGTPIQQLLVRTKDGKYFGVAGVAPNATAVAVAVKPSEALAQMRPLFAKAQPRMPPGAESTVDSFISLGYGGGGADTRTAKTGRLEDSITAIQKYGANRKSTVLAPGSYAAIVEKSPEVELGTDATEESSLHMVVGRW